MARASGVRKRQSRIDGTGLQGVNYCDALDFYVLLAGQVNALLAQDGFEEVKAGGTSGL